MWRRFRSTSRRCTVRLGRVRGARGSECQRRVGVVDPDHARSGRLSWLRGGGTAKDRRASWVGDLPIGGWPMVLCGAKRVWSCRHERCEVKAWTPGPAGPALRTVGGAHRAGPGRPPPSRSHAPGHRHRASPALGVFLHTVMRQATGRGTQPWKTRLAWTGSPRSGSTSTSGSAVVGRPHPICHRHHRPHPGSLGVAAEPDQRSLRDGAAWLAGQPEAWRAQILTAALDPFRG